MYHGKWAANWSTCLPVCGQLKLPCFWHFGSLTGGTMGSQDPRNPPFSSSHSRGSSAAQDPRVCGSGAASQTDCPQVRDTKSTRISSLGASRQDDHPRVEDPRDFPFTENFKILGFCFKPEWNLMSKYCNPLWKGKVFLCTALITTMNITIVFSYRRSWTPSQAHLCQVCSQMCEMGLSRISLLCFCEGFNTHSSALVFWFYEAEILQNAIQLALWVFIYRYLPLWFILHQIIITSNRFNCHLNNLAITSMLSWGDHSKFRLKLSGSAGFLDLC